MERERERMKTRHNYRRDLFTSFPEYKHLNIIYWNNMIVIANC